MSDQPRDGVPPVDADATKPQPEPHHPARTIGPYRLLQLIGEGGMGEVWLAAQTHPVRRQVALKVIKAGMDTAQVVTRFEAERQALALVDIRP
jgi:serine/threonine protein kinase